MALNVLNNADLMEAELAPSPNIDSTKVFSLLKTLSLKSLVCVCPCGFGWPNGIPLAASSISIPKVSSIPLDLAALSHCFWEPPDATICAAACPSPTGRPSASKFSLNFLECVEQLLWTSKLLSPTK